MTQATKHQPRQLRAVELFAREYALLSQPQGQLALELLLPLLMLLSALQLLLRTGYGPALYARRGVHGEQTRWRPCWSLL